MDDQQEDVKLDPKYEFEAPQYVDFALPDAVVGEAGSDEWFEGKEVVEELKTEDLFVNTKSEDFATTDAHSKSTNKGGQRKRALDASSADKDNSTTFARPLKKSRPSIQLTNPRTSLTRIRSVRKKTPATNKLNRSKANTTMNSSTWVPKLTMPQSPMLATSSRIRTHEPEDSDTAQERYIASAILDQAKRRRLNSFYKKKALYCSTGYMPAHSAKPLTEPEEFHFTTDDRFGVTQPKHDDTHQTKKPAEWQGITVPQPFVFSSEFRVRPDSPQPSSPFKSFKQKMMEIQNKTPKRFRTKPRNYVFGQSPETSIELNLTIPQPFNLETSFRIKPTTVLSREEQEAQEMQNMPQFRARPINKRVLESDGQVGISRVPKQPLTEPHAFSLATDMRASIKETSKPVEPEHEQFKAKPLDISVLQGPVKGVPVVERPQLTIPASPCLLTKQRYHPPSALEEPEEVFVFKAKAAPVFKEPKPVVREKHVVEPAPFKLNTEVRGKEAMTKMEKKLEEVREAEEKAHKFKAQPMIISETPVPPMREVVCTQPEPFKLTIEERGAEHKKKFIAKIQEEMKENQDRANFKATLFVPTQPFEPQKSTKPLTVIDDFALNSDVRAVERHTYDVQQLEKAQAAEEARKKQEAAHMTQEAIELKLLRAKMVPKAQPIFLGKPLHILPSSQPLTQPHTPKLRTKARSMAGRDL